MASIRGSQPRDEWFNTLVVRKNLTTSNVTTGGALHIAGPLDFAKSPASITHLDEPVATILADHHLQVHVPVVIEQNCNVGGVLTSEAITTGDLECNNAVITTLSSSSATIDTLQVNNINDGLSIDGASIGTDVPAVGIFSVLQTDLPLHLNDNGTPKWRFALGANEDLLIQHLDNGNLWVTKQTISAL